MAGQCHGVCVCVRVEFCGAYGLCGYRRDPLLSSVNSKSVASRNGSFSSQCFAHLLQKPQLGTVQFKPSPHPHPHSYPLGVTAPWDHDILSARVSLFRTLFLFHFSLSLGPHLLSHPSVWKGGLSVVSPSPTPFGRPSVSIIKG